MIKRLIRWVKLRRIHRAGRIIASAFPASERLFILDNHGVLVASGNLKQLLSRAQRSLSDNT